MASFRDASLKLEKLLLDRATCLLEGLDGASGKLDILANDELFRELARIDDLHTGTTDDLAKDFLFDKSIACHLFTVLEMLLETIERNRKELLVDRLETAQLLHPLDERRPATFKERIFLLAMRTLSLGATASSRTALSAATDTLRLFPRSKLEFVDLHIDILGGGFDFLFL